MPCRTSSPCTATAPHPKILFTHGLPTSHLLTLSLPPILGPSTRPKLQTYIVHVRPDELPGAYFPLTKLHRHLSFLEQVILTEEEEEGEGGGGGGGGGGGKGTASSRLLYSYHTAVEGFAARLTENEAAALQTSPGIVPGGAWAKSGLGRGSIIGVLDTGVWPESPSFSDHQMPPLPSGWQGVCQDGENFNSSSCNRKLIGARFYSKGHRANYPTNPPASSSSLLEYMSPRDAHGHGTHTASTAAGTTVNEASVFGLGTGVAQGMAPEAHVAVYKVCWFNGCYSSDILAGMDDAIQDGNGVWQSYALPGTTGRAELSGQRGPLGHNRRGKHHGPAVPHVPPAWQRPDPVRRVPVSGKQVFEKWGKKALELVHESGGSKGAEYCLKGSLSRARVAGKMVVCDRGINGRAEKGEAVKEAGGAAMVLANAEINLQEDSVDVHVLPATMIGFKESTELKKYINSTRRPVGQLVYGGTTVGRARAPAVALFSSRGPSMTNPSVLKPDVIAPGVNIIAAWPDNLGPTSLPDDLRRSNFTVLSGTSMACPHVSGITALVRSAHPSWSPAAVRSAIMTTADVVDHYGKPIMDGRDRAGLFAIGAGHVNPTKAMDPGLVYDIEPNDYITHLCTLGYSHLEIFTIAHRNTNCNETLHRNNNFSLNYPSISIAFKQNSTRVMIQRKLTNVGTPNSTYAAQVVAPRGVKVSVTPAVLTFKEVTESKSFQVRFKSTKRMAVQEALLERVFDMEGHKQREDLVRFGSGSVQFRSDPPRFELDSLRLGSDRTHFGSSRILYGLVWIGPTSIRVESFMVWFRSDHFGSGRIFHGWFGSDPLQFESNPSWFGSDRTTSFGSGSVQFRSDSPWFKSNPLWFGSVRIRFGSDQIGFTLVQVESLMVRFKLN
uniref:Subtilisin-like protease SBT1.2 n=1 Tax=Ananas comosus var. bracteatus TaxID=296719 RepID=A0A6V7PHE5_ANACO|nr:unnamed protein product [Ananas comosus var. bracteatus]